MPGKYAPMMKGARSMWRALQAISCAANRAANGGPEGRTIGNLKALCRWIRDEAKKAMAAATVKVKDEPE
jgi:hypothetical protein